MTIIEIDARALADACGGMNLDGARRSGDIEDRRGLSREASLNAPTRPSPALPPLIRRPGDLSSQAGLDDIK